MTEENLDFLSVDSIWEFVNNVDIKKLDLIRESIETEYGNLFRRLG